MRFFPGIRGGGDKTKVSASQIYKQKLSGKAPEEKTVAQKYKEMIDAKMEKMMEDVITGRKKTRTRLPGTKPAGEDEQPKELSNNARLMLKMLAARKLKQEQKQEKKKAQEEMWALKSKKKAEAMAKTAKEAAEYQRQQDDAAAAQASTSGSDDKSGWW